MEILLELNKLEQLANQKPANPGRIVRLESNRMELCGNSRTLAQETF